MATVMDFYRALDQWAPFSTQMEFDNAGLCDKVLASLPTGGTNLCPWNSCTAENSILPTMWIS